jgi:hypothetical protein
MSEYTTMDKSSEDRLSGVEIELLTIKIAFIHRRYVSRDGGLDLGRVIKSLGFGRREGHR